MATRFHIHTEPGRGTLAAADLTAPTPTRSRTGDADTAAEGYFCLPAAGEQVSGDALAVAAGIGRRDVLVVDGLGHGHDAAIAARAATGSFHTSLGLPLVDAMRSIHQGITGTRGAAVALLRISPSTVEFCGVGNVHALVHDGTGDHHLLSRPGIVGRGGALVPAVQRRPLTGPATIVVHTDGVHGQPLPATEIVPSLSPTLLAARLIQRHRQPRDDATVLVLTTGGTA
ncbi:SpoIIE family protein phosphatase [Amycolatopsis sp. CA-230715]|uniref:SpoIIE family protein phosphatase n=1 Tax=Amycolatopsis sp. CA-230715 TaxID=2745196 RepID=UPI001C02F8E7|nr:SpoIIE family protein phosphatase [Amycolatopsis sp. CA-230715]QWF81102.1 hypothetical protein HUW46_04528 [Amycolatopsis sp. CA-230715]